MTIMKAYPHNHYVSRKGGFLGEERAGGKNEQDMLCSTISPSEEGIGGTDDLLRPNIAVDRDRVKPFAAPESTTSGGVSPVESEDGAGWQWWIESGR